MVVESPDTSLFRDTAASRVFLKFPFLVEVWYWGLIYWVSLGHRFDMVLANELQVYQLGRAFTAVTLLEGTVHVARKHAMQLVHLEERLHIFWEPAIQAFFMQYPLVMTWINRIYSFIHIPGMPAPSKEPKQLANFSS
jgi:hypothetical protein